MFALMLRGPSVALPGRVAVQEAVDASRRAVHAFVAMNPDKLSLSDWRVHRAGIGDQQGVLRRSTGQRVDRLLLGIRCRHGRRHRRRSPPREAIGTRIPDTEAHPAADATPRASSEAGRTSGHRAAAGRPLQRPRSCSWRPELLRRRMDERGDIFPVAAPDLADLDRVMCSADAPFDRRPTTDGGVEVLAQGRSAKVLLLGWLAGIVGRQQARASPRRPTCSASREGPLRS